MLWGSCKFLQNVQLQMFQKYNIFSELISNNLKTLNLENVFSLQVLNHLPTWSSKNNNSNPLSLGSHELSHLLTKIKSSVICKHKN